MTRPPARACPYIMTKCIVDRLETIKINIKKRTTVIFSARSHFIHIQGKIQKGPSVGQPGESVVIRCSFNFFLAALFLQG